MSRIEISGRVMIVSLYKTVHNHVIIMLHRSVRLIDLYLNWIGHSPVNDVYVCHVECQATKQS